MGYIDLHIHSSASDGTLTPAQVVSLAVQSGLEAIALTDHDTTDGIAQARKTAADLGLELVPGIELSSLYQGKDIHILGLFIHEQEPALIQALEQFRQIRRQRNITLLDNLAKGGMPLTWEMVTQGDPNTVITRAHVARALVAAGYASSLDQAFRSYLTYGGKYCPPKASPAPEAVVQVLLDNHAFVALAHPWQYKLGDQGTRKLIEHLKELGMQGLEVYHSSHNSYESAKLQVIAKQLNLLPTGGSDFHGANKPDISIGTGRGGLRVSYSLLKDIKSLLASSSQQGGPEPTL